LQKERKADLFDKEELVKRGFSSNEGRVFCLISLKQKLIKKTKKLSQGLQFVQNSQNMKMTNFGKTLRNHYLSERIIIALHY